MAKTKDPFICKHGNDIELCKEICACAHGCDWHGVGDCGLCGCPKFAKAKAKKPKPKDA